MVVLFSFKIHVSAQVLNYTKTCQVNFIFLVKTFNLNSLQGFRKKKKNIRTFFKLSIYIVAHFKQVTHVTLQGLPKNIELTTYNFYNKNIVHPKKNQNQK